MSTATISQPQNYIGKRENPKVRKLKVFVCNKNIFFLILLLGALFLIIFDEKKYKIISNVVQ